MWAISNSSRGDDEEEKEKDFQSKKEEEDEDFKFKKEEDDEFSFAYSIVTTFKGDNDSITSFLSLVSFIQDGVAVEFENSCNPTENQNENSTNSHFLRKKNLSGGSSRSHFATNSFSNLDEPKDSLQ